MNKGFISRMLSGLKLKLWDPRLTPALCCVLLLLLIDFSVRFVSFNQRISDNDRIPAVHSVGVVPRLDDGELTSYLEKLDIVEPRLVVSQVEKTPVIDVDTKNGFGDGYWESGVFSYRLIAIAKRSERFAVFDRTQNSTDVRDVIELRLGESIDEYLVTDISVKGVTLTAGSKEAVRLTLFEQTNQAAEAEKK